MRRHSFGSVSRLFESRILLAAVALAGGSFPISQAAAATPTFTSIYSFYGPDGSNPNGKLLFDAAGNVYGTTFYGGANGKGSIFKLTVSGGTFTESVLYSFQGADDGGNPTAGLVMDASGALFGTASTSNGEAKGTVFQLVPPVGAGTWTYNVLHSFAGGAADGGFPNCDLIFGSKGALYGTTVLGGTNNHGTAFDLTPPAVAGGAWTENVIYSFLGPTDGAEPYAGLAFDASGNLIGTAAAGGSGSSGTVFLLTKPAAHGGVWTETTLYSFTGVADGKLPLSGVYVGSKGSIFGTTYLGGSGNGVVYQLTPVAGGTFTQSVLWTFSGTDGANPSDSVLEDKNGDFYGTTGGAANGTAGNVFKLTHAKGGTYTESSLYTFTGKSDGQAPLSALIIDKSGALYGTTFYGGAGGAGSVFRIK